MHPFQSGDRFNPPEQRSESSQVWSPPPRNEDTASSSSFQPQQQGASAAESQAVAAEKGGSTRSNSALTPLSQEALQLLNSQSEAAALASKEWVRRDRSQVANGEWLLIGIPTVKRGDEVARDVRTQG
jgi:hypothetical protein